MARSDYYIKGFRLTVENAQRLYDAAITMEERKDYAIATSLLVLSAEEGMKALNILSYHFLPELTQKDFEKSFEDHKHKIEGIRNLMGLSQIMEKFFELYYFPVLKNMVEPKADFERAKNESFENLKDGLQLILNKKSKVLQQNSWWRSAKSMKENGFYVSYSKGRWISPISTKKEGYQKSKEYVSGFLNHVKSIYSIDLDDPIHQGLFATVKGIVESIYKGRTASGI